MINMETSGNNLLIETTAVWEQQSGEYDMTAASWISAVEMYVILHL